MLTLGALVHHGYLPSGDYVGGIEREVRRRYDASPVQELRDFLDANHEALMVMTRDLLSLQVKMRVLEKMIQERI